MNIYCVRYETVISGGIAIVQRWVGTELVEAESPQGAIDKLKEKDDDFELISIHLVEKKQTTTKEREE